MGLVWRAKNILEYVSAHSLTCFAVVDDLPLDVPNFVRIDGARGLTPPDAGRLIEILHQNPIPVVPGSTRIE